VEKRKRTSFGVSSIAGINLMLDVPQLPNDSQLLSLHFTSPRPSVELEGGGRKSQFCRFHFGSEEGKEIHLHSPPSPGAVYESYHSLCARRDS
jgi:hypothetical protein